MDHMVMILGNETSQYSGLSGLLEKNGYQSRLTSDLSVLTETISEKEKPAAIVLDLDAIPPDNHVFRSFKRNNPGIVLLAVSERSFHPDLVESMERHFFACMVKPVDPDEFLFLLKSGCDENNAMTTR